jgi:hypothetical protein
MKSNVMNWAAVAAILLGCCSCSSTPNPSDWNKLGWWHRVATDPPTYVPTGYAANRPRTAQDGRWFIDRRDGKRVFVPNTEVGGRSPQLLEGEARKVTDSPRPVSKPSAGEVVAIVAVLPLAPILAVFAGGIAPHP